LEEANCNDAGVEAKTDTAFLFVEGALVLGCSSLALFMVSEDLIDVLVFLLANQEEHSQVLIELQLDY
jgi:hypothetical protein